MSKCTRAHAYMICIYSEKKLNTPWPCCLTIYTHTYTLQTKVITRKIKHIIPVWKKHVYLVLSFIFTASEDTEYISQEMLSI